MAQTYADMNVLDEKHLGEKPTVIEEGGITQVLSKDGVMAEQIEVKPTLGERLKAHFKKWCVYVGYPRIAQDGVNKSTLTTNSLNMSDTYSDHAHVKLNQEIGSKSIFKPKIYSFSANLSLPHRGVDRPFMTVQVPETKAQDGQKFTIEQETNLPVDEFTRYTTTVVQEKNFDVIVYGKPTLQQGKLPKVGVTYNQTVHMKGLNKLKGFELNDVKIDMGAFESFINEMLNISLPFTASAFIPNPSVMTLYLGNVTILPTINGTVDSAFGTSIMHDVITTPGGNNFSVTGSMNLAKSLPALSGTTLDLSLATTQCIYKGRNLTYFGDALATNPLPYKINLKDVIENSL
ncbi:hypothetical protein KEM55_001982 [Ascosphaera atra]|nr:hypothetical protein KEM55_001982 [Ascosphaera atra]